MRVRNLGKSGIEVTELCLGTMMFGSPRNPVPESEWLGTIDAYVDAGGNFIDTADAYSAGASESVVGKALKGRRDAIVVATKGYFPMNVNFGEPPAHVNALGSSRRHLIESLDGSLRRLGTDYIDLYQVHCWDPRTPLEETLRTLDDMVRHGKVRYVGLSNYSAWQIVEAAQLCARHGWEPFVTAQMQYSLLCRTIEDDVIPACERYGIGLLPWSPLGGGILTGKYLGDAEPDGARFTGEPPSEAARQWRELFRNQRNLEVARTVAAVADELGTTPIAVSLAWLLTRSTVSSVILGPRDRAQLDGNLACLELTLPDDAIAKLEAASAPPERYPEVFIQRAPRT